MTGYAKLSAAVYPTSNSITVSADQYTATAGSDASYSEFQTCFVAQTLTSGRYFFSIVVGGNGIQFGVGDIANWTPSITTAPNGVYVDQDGAYNFGEVYTNTGGTQTALYSYGNLTAGTVIDFAFDTGSGTGSSGTKQIWLRVNGGGWNPWVGGTPNPDTNTGGQSLSHVTDFTAFIRTYLTSGIATINTGASAYAYTPPTTFGNLPPTFNGSLASPIANTPVLETGADLVVDWLDTGLTGLQVSVDGGTFTTMTGGTTGNSGAATLSGGISSAGLHSLAFQSTGSALTDQTPLSYLGAFARPSGAGTMAAAIFHGGADGSASQTVSILGGPLNYAWMDATYLAFGGIAASPSYIGIEDSAGNTLTIAQFSNNTTGSNTITSSGGSLGSLPLTGPAYVTLAAGLQQSVIAEFDATGVVGSSVTGSGTVSMNGTVAIYSPVVWETSPGNPLDKLYVKPTGAGYSQSAAAVWGVASAPPAQPLPWRSPLRTIIKTFHDAAGFAGRAGRGPAVGRIPDLAPVLPVRPGRLPQTIAAHFTPEPFAGRQRVRVAIGPVPPPPVLGKPFNRVAQALRSYAAHFTEPPYPGQRQPRWWPMNYGGGVNLPARASQVVTEALLTDAAPVRASQTVVEALMRDAASVRASQAVVEALYQQSNPTYVRASQIVVEVLVPLLEMPLPPVYPILIGLTFDYVKRNKQSVGRGVASSGREIAVNYWTYPQWEWDLNYDILADTGQNVGTTASDIKTLLGFVLNMQGSYSPFFFQDPDDNAVTGQALGAGDGTTTTFTFIRTYGQDSALGDFLGTEPIGGLNMNEAINIYIGGVQQESGYTIDNSTPYGNTVAFTTPPAVDAVITADFSFYYFCRIKEDTLEMKKFMYQLWAVDRVTIFSLKN